MQHFEHFARAPITEALIDIRVTLPDDVTVEHIAPLKDLLSSSYPEQTNIMFGQWQFNMNFIEVPKVQTDSHITGYRLVSSDQRRIIQARLDGFTFSALPPYPGWSEFQTEACRVWRQYRELLPALSISRVATRFINQLNIPETTFELRRYLRTYPETSTDMPYQSIGQYFLQLTLPMPDIQASMIVNQTIVPPPSPQEVSILLDLDLWRDQDVPQQEEDLWGFFEVLRDRKNAMFVSCITERTKDLIR